jgi:glyoxalase family protein
MREVNGIHHITAFCGDPQRNIDFYSHVLGLRMVKISINQDDPGTYHLYYGDELGRPGSAITFFPWPHARPGRIGHGQTAVTAYSIPAGSVEYWKERLVARGYAPFGPESRFSEQVLSLEDPDGLLIELVADQNGDPRPGWTGSDVPAEHAIGGFHSATLWLADLGPSQEILVETLGFRILGDEGSRRRLVVGDGRPGQIVDLIAMPERPRALDGVGVVHHIAWQVEDEAHELEVRSQVMSAGLRPTPVIDRSYFESVYFREPGGVLYELATAGPGFTFDESAEELGSDLMLTPPFQPHREAIRAGLPAITLPSGRRIP